MVTRPGSRILGTGHFVPDNVRSNLDIERLVDTSDEWIRSRTGIRERRVAPDGMLTSDMAAAAAKNALEASGTLATELDLIVVATITPDVPMPATAAIVQRKIGAGNIAAFDAAAACAGFVFGLAIADSFIRAGNAKRVLLVGVEMLSRVVNWSDRTTCILFGDGAGAVVLGPTDDDRGLLATRTHTDGSLAGALVIQAGGTAMPVTPEAHAAGKDKIAMKGQEVFRVAVKNLLSASQATVDAAGLTGDDIDWVVPHQANLRIIDQVIDRAKYPREKVLSNIERVGNTSSASIPILLDESVRSGRIKPRDVVLMCALGAGISWGASLVRM